MIKHANLEKLSGAHQVTDGPGGDNTLNKLLNWQKELIGLKGSSSAVP